MAPWSPYTIGIYDSTATILGIYLNDDVKHDEAFFVAPKSFIDFANTRTSC